VEDLVLANWRAWVVSSRRRLSLTRSSNRAQKYQGKHPTMSLTSEKTGMMDPEWLLRSFSNEKQTMSSIGFLHSSRIRLAVVCPNCRR
jgi:hypothetical protein